MSPAYRVEHHLVNGSTGDPALFVHLGGRRGALLFDCGQLMDAPAAHLHRVGQLFISHTHMDHFFGFDWFLRVALGQSRCFTIWGPTGIRKNVRSKLEGYTWNIAMDFHLELVVHEIAGPVVRTSRYRAEDGLELSEDVALRELAPEGPLFENHAFCVRHTELDHDIPSLAFRFTQKTGVALDEGRLQALGVRPGPWVAAFCRWVLKPNAPDYLVPVGEDPVSAGTLRPAATVQTGLELAYVADTRWTEQVVERAVQLAKGVDVLYCAAKFLERERERAVAACHLTALEAGRLARLAEVEELVLFHPSKKYQDDYDELVREARKEFAAVTMQL